MQGEQWRKHGIAVLCALGGICLTAAGCTRSHAPAPVEAPLPRELRMTTLPTYVVEPPDILIITMMNTVPKPPYKIQPLDVLVIQVSNLVQGLPPIAGPISVMPNGAVFLGHTYGSVTVEGLSLEEATSKIQEFLQKNFSKNALVSLSLGQSRAMMQVQGQHIVRMDGTISLGVYGSAYIAGLTLDQARRVIETYLSQFLLKPEISLDVFSYNSKWYYLIMDRAGSGETVVRLPITGRDTVLDALSQMFGTQQFSSRRQIWVARPNGQNPNEMQLFPVNWQAITQGGSPATNYQLLPGDRLYVKANPLFTITNRMNQYFAPLQSVMGMTLFGSATVSTVQGTVQQFQNGALGAGGVGGFGGGFR